MLISPGVGECRKLCAATAAIESLRANQREHRRRLQSAGGGLNRGRIYSQLTQLSLSCWLGQAGYASRRARHEL
jgi:hypothetical protein